MGTPLEPTPTALFLGITYRDEAEMQKALGLFEETFGQANRRCGPIDFSLQTDYYDAEMGDGLKKLYLTFGSNFDRNRLSAVKRMSNDIEAQFCDGTSRRVNLDPGYITNDKFVLASTKDFFHRIYVGDGIYAEVTLHFRHGKYRFFSWTYPDYKNEAVLALLVAARAELVGRVRRERG